MICFFSFIYICGGVIFVYINLDCLYFIKKCKIQVGVSGTNTFGTRTEIKTTQF